MALEFPIPPGGWRLSRYACRLILEETGPDVWESFNHWTLERWHTESVPAAMAGFSPETGNKIKGLSVSIGRSQLTTDSAKTFICTSDAFQPYSERAAHVRRRQRWEHFTERRYRPYPVKPPAKRRDAGLDHARLYDRP